MQKIITMDYRKLKQNVSIISEVQSWLNHMINRYVTPLYFPTGSSDNLWDNYKQNNEINVSETMTFENNI
jgi:hypothetical protein